MPPPEEKALYGRVTSVDVEDAALVVRFALERGPVPEVEDRLHLGERGDLETVRGVGRLLRILRAGRVRAPRDPYALAAEPKRAAELLARCIGARVTLRVARRTDRVLTVWTESGVERISGILDYEEEADGLSVRRCGGYGLLRIPRESMIRFEPSSSHRYEIVSIEP